MVVVVNGKSYLCLSLDHLDNWNIDNEAELGCERGHQSDRVRLTDEDKKEDGRLT